MTVVRPLGLWVGDRFEPGLEVEIEGGRPVRWRGTSLPPEPIWISPSFVNAHSHLEYRGFLGKLPGLPYWDWLRALTQLKSATAPSEWAVWAAKAAHENRITGVGLIAEHSDAPVAAAALADAGIVGWVFQELITFAEQNTPEEKKAIVRAKANSQAGKPGIEVRITPHSLFLVDPTSFEEFNQQDFVSVHYAETEFETQLFLHGVGPIAELYERMHFPVPKRGHDVATELEQRLGSANTIQLVHACAAPRPTELDPNRYTIAWCPRSNLNLYCPPLPIDRIDWKSVRIGLGMDSAASSGPINMFEELRAAWACPTRSLAQISATDLWAIATTGGAASLLHSKWGTLATGDDNASWIAIRNGANTVEELLLTSQPDMVQWL